MAKAGDDEKSREAEMSLSISSWESKITERLLLFVVLLVLVLAAAAPAVAVAVAVAAVVVLFAVVLVVVVTILLLLLILLSTSKAVDMFVAYEEFSSKQQFELEVTSEFCRASGNNSESQNSKIRALIGLESSSCSEWHKSNVNNMAAKNC